MTNWEVVASIIIRDCTIVTMDPRRRIIRGGAVAINGSYIEAVGKSDEVCSKYTAEKIIDAKGRLLLPGLINTHTHYFQNLLKGLGDDLVLSDWAKNLIGPSVPKLTEDDCYEAALAGCLEAIKSGTSCTVDFMYAHHRPRLSDAVIKAFKEIGIRGILARGVTDAGEEWGMTQELIQDPNVALNDCERIFREYNGDGDGRIQVWIAPDMIWSVTRECLERCRDLANKLKTRLTIHIAETPHDVKACEQLYGMRDLEFLDSIGVANSNLLAVHCVYVTPREIRIMKVRDVRVSHCPVSNMYLSSGVAPVPRMNEAGITTGLGVDGAASNNNQDMIQCMKFAALLHKVHNTYDATAFTCERAIEMATIDGARAVGLEEQIGSIEPGKKADVIIVDLLRPNTVPCHYPVSSLVYCASGDNVESVIIDGKLVMENRTLKTVKEEEVLERAKSAAESLVERAGIGKLRDRPWRSMGF